MGRIYREVEIRPTQGRRRVNARHRTDGERKRDTSKLVRPLRTVVFYYTSSTESTALYGTVQSFRHAP